MSEWSEILNLANKHHQNKNFDKAQEVLMKGACLFPNLSEFYYLIGIINYENNHKNKATEHLYRASVVSENHEHWLNYAIILVQTRRFDLALEAFHHAHALNPGDAPTRLGLAERLLGRGRERLAAADHTAAAEDFDAAARLVPDQAVIHQFRGIARQSAGRHAAAAAAYQTALALEPAQAEILCNLGLAAVRLGDIDKAEAALRRTLRLDASKVEAYAGLINILLESGRHAEGLRASALCLALAPCRVEALKGVAMAKRDLGVWEHENDIRRAEAVAEKKDVCMLRTLRHLSEGDWEQGWDGYAERWSDARMLPYRPLGARPIWRGEPLNGELLVWGEQGLGDEIMFLSLLPDVLAQGAAVRLVIDKRLHPLVKRAFPGVPCFERDEAAENISAWTDVEAQISLGDLPALFRRRPADFPAAPPPWLRPDPTAVAAAQARHGGGRGRLLIGVSWRSSNPIYGAARSVDLSLLGRRLASDGARLVCLQYGDVAADIAAARADGVEIEVDPLVDPWSDTDGLAALTAAMDLVASVDNTTAHLSGALGVDTWTLLPQPAEWRWMRDRKDSPWYPTMRLLRQPAPGDWPGALAGLANLHRRSLERFQPKRMPVRRGKRDKTKP